MLVTAELPSTYADSANHLGLIADTDLSELYSCLEHRCQILYQLSEIDSPVCCEVEQHLIVVKCILSLNELHVQLMLCDLLKTYAKCSLALLLVILVSSGVILCGNSYDRLE